MGVLTWKGGYGEGGAPASEIITQVPSWIKGGEPLRRKPCRARSFSPGAGCTARQTENGAGGSNLGAPDLTEIAGEQRHDAAKQRSRYLEDPASVTPGSPMPKFESLGDERLSPARDLPRGLERQEVET